VIARVLGAALACLGAFAAAARPSPPDPFPRAGRSYLVVVNGAEVWARAADAPLAPASLTKIMTALLALEAGGDPGAWIEISPRVAAQTGSRLGLAPGDALRAEDALAATLVGSANDACLALATHVGGSEAAFVARMNARARALGLGQTRFANPCGFDAPGHAASARDLAALTRAALAVPAFRRLVAREGGEVTTRAGRRIAFRASNVLLGRVEGVRGVKSGYTARAGRCVVVLAERGDVEVLVVLLDAKDRWWTAAALVEEAFEQARERG
jgi:D-alanyl-D-alanine carboxypeptidase (penicillin-binding protein 5/6)